MTKTTKILLAISLTAFAVGFTNIIGGIGTPLGAVFLGLFLLSKILAKETALFDEEQRLRIAAAERHTASVSRRAHSGTQEARGATLSSAPAYSARLCLCHDD